MTSNSLHPGAIKTDLLRHIDDVFGSLGSNLLSNLLLQIKEIGLNLIAMDADQGALTQVNTIQFLFLFSYLFHFFLFFNFI